MSVVLYYALSFVWFAGKCLCKCCMIKVSRDTKHGVRMSGLKSGGDRVYDVTKDEAIPNRRKKDSDQPRQNEKLTPKTGATLGA